MEALKTKLSDLGIFSLADDWIQSVVAGNYEAESELPDEILSELGDLDVFYDRLCDARTALESWVTAGRKKYAGKEKIGPDHNWEVCINWNLTSQRLLSFFRSFVKNDICHVEDCDTVRRAFAAARLYVTFFTIPGAATFNMFHIAFFDKCMELLDIAKVLSSTQGKDAQPKSKKPVDPENTANEEPQEPTFTQSEKSTMMKDLCLFLEDLCKSLNFIDLKPEIISPGSIIKALVGVTLLDTEANIFDKPPKIYSIGYAALKAYSVLEVLCSERHGEVKRIIQNYADDFRHVLFSRIPGDDGVRKTPILHFLSQICVKYPLESYFIVLLALQRAVQRVPDKAEVRTNTASALAEFFSSNELPQMQFQFSFWLVSELFAETVRAKTTAVEVISKLVNLPDRTERQRLHEFYLSALLTGSLDKSPLVRYKALNSFATSISSNQVEIQRIMNKLFVNAGDFLDNNKVSVDDFFDFVSFFEEHPDSPMPLLPDNILPPGNRIVKMLELFTRDSRVYVRKSAYLGLSNIFFLDERWINNSRLQCLSYGCLDSSVLIRKAMTKCVTDLLLKYPRNDGLIEAWVNGILPLVADPDTKNQERIMEYIHEMMINKLTDLKNTNTPEANLPWKMIKMIARKERRKLLRVAIRTWVSQNLIPDRVFKDLVTHFHSDHKNSAWYFAVCLSEYMDWPKPDVILNYFYTNIHEKNDNPDDALESLVLEVLFLSWRALPKDSQEKLYADLATSLSGYTVPLWQLTRSLDILFLMDREKTEDLCRSLIEASGENVLSIISSEERVNPAILSRHIFIIGEAAMFSPGVPEDVIQGLADILETDCVCSRAGKSITDLKAVCVITLGKLCLQDHLIAKRFVPILARLLNDSVSSVSVKSNSLCALSDLCVRFAAVVEDYLGDMCVALKNEEKEVRKSALQNISKLVMEDYLKLKSPIFFYLLTMLLDPSPQIREIFVSFIANSVLKKSPGIMSHFFIQAIFFFNNYEGKKGIDKSELSANEKRCFNLAGVSNFKSREAIYKYMLRNMEDDYRFRVQNRLIIDILDRVCDNKIELNIIGRAVLKDALNVMACQEMRLNHLKKDDDETPAEDFACDQFVIGMAKKLILTKVLKKNYVESLVPVVARLKRKLMDLRSPLAKDLMICIREIMKDFKEEIDEIFAADPELAAEVAFDLRDVPGDNVLAEIDEADFEAQSKINCISMLAMGEDIEDYVERTLHDLVGPENDTSDDEQKTGDATPRPKSPLLRTPQLRASLIAANESVQESGDMDPQTPKPSCNDSQSPRTSDAFSSSKLGLPRRRVPVDSDDSTPSGSTLSPRPHSLSTEYSSNVPVQHILSDSTSCSISKESPSTSRLENSAKKSKKRGGRKHKKK